MTLKKQTLSNMNRKRRMRKKVGKNICNKMEMIKKERLIIKMGKKYLI